MASGQGIVSSLPSRGLQKVSHELRLLCFSMLELPAWLPFGKAYMKGAHSAGTIPLSQTSMAPCSKRHAVCCYVIPIRKETHYVMAEVYSAANREAAKLLLYGIKCQASPWLTRTP